LREGPPPDFIGLAGSGEPTLHSGIGEIIDGIKRMTDVPIAVLTNGSLLWDPNVQRSLCNADLVLPSLDAGSPETYQRVNRPHPGIPFDRMVEGLVDFTRGFKGRVDLEVFVLSGLTDQEEEIRRIAALAQKIRPSRVQLNTVTRPPAESAAVPVSPSSLERLCKIFQLPCEVIAEHPLPPKTLTMERQAAEEQILSLLERRPCTVDGIATGLGLAPNDVIKHLDHLESVGKLRSERRENGLFYSGVNEPS
jgi:wyosine [tRNA(Phe)-imidazoG37] synthetase (radical SAM superfamily)